MFTQRDSISAVCGYSSLSTMFLSKVAAYRRSASSSIQVVTKVARLNRAFPSSITSSMTIWYAVWGSISRSGRRFRGTSTIPARVKRGTTVRSSDSSLWLFQTPMGPLPFSSGDEGERLSPSQDLRLLRGELVLGEDSLCLQVAELLELVQPVVGRGCGSLCGDLRGSGLLLVG